MRERRKKLETIASVPRIATPITAISMIATSGVWCVTKLRYPVHARRTPDERTTIPSNIAANPWTFPRPYSYFLFHRRPEIQRAREFVSETNISRNESIAEPRIARDPERNPIIALITASIRDTTIANRIPDCGVVGRLIIYR